MKYGEMMVAVWGAMVLAGGAGTAMAQGGEKMQATIRGGGGDGKCTFEVEVDGVAEVEIRGDQGYLRTLAGSPATWRRLECNQALPASSNDFRFKGVDGRGSQDLARDPNSNRGAAVIRIEDPQGGREGYTGDITWKGGSEGWRSQANWNGGISSGSANSSGTSGGSVGGSSSGQGWGSGAGGGGWGSGSGNGQGWGSSGGMSNGRRISQGDAMNACRNEASNRFGVPASAVRMDRGNDPGNGGYGFNYTVEHNGRRQSGYCGVGANGEIGSFDGNAGGMGGMGSGQAGGYGNRRTISPGEAVTSCRMEASRRLNVPLSTVQAQPGSSAGNGSYTVGLRVDRGGITENGYCTISAFGEILNVNRDR